jgi:hypothetical protein
MYNWLAQTSESTTADCELQTSCKHKFDWTDELRDAFTITKALGTNWVSDCTVRPEQGDDHPDRQQRAATAWQINAARRPSAQLEGICPGAAAATRSCVAALRGAARHWPARAISAALAGSAMVAPEGEGLARRRV